MDSAKEKAGGVTKLDEILGDLQILVNDNLDICKQYKNLLMKLEQCDKEEKESAESKGPPPQ